MVGSQSCSRRGGGQPDLCGACFGCGCRKNLELDCKEPQGDAHHKMEISTRMSFYWRQYKLGNLQLLCSHYCHKKKSVAEYKAWLEKQENEPF